MEVVFIKKEYEGLGKIQWMSFQLKMDMLRKLSFTRGA
jgi:hypothetical protein